MKITKKINLKRNTKKTTLVMAVCRNCDNQLQGPYCEKCGQYLFSGVKRNVGNLVFNALENMFVLDNKIFVTLKNLLFYPGKLTQEYMHGRMVKYVHPSKLFWFITIVFFTLLTSKIKDIDENKKQDASTNQLLANTNNSINTVSKEKIKQLFNLHPDSSKISKMVTEEVEKAKLEENAAKKEDESFTMSDLRNYISTYAPYMTFLLIPFFAFLSYILFHKKNCFYVDYFAFALHFHTFVFLLYTIYIGIYTLFPQFKYHGTVFLLIPLIYFLRAAWVVYHPKLKALVLKTILIGILYSITLSIATVLFIIFIAIIKDPNSIKDLFVDFW